MDIDDAAGLTAPVDPWPESSLPLAVPALHPAEPAAAAAPAGPAVRRLWWRGPAAALGVLLLVAAGAVAALASRGPTAADPGVATTAPEPGGIAGIGAGGSSQRPGRTATTASPGSTASYQPSQPAASGPTATPSATVFRSGEVKIAVRGKGQAVDLETGKKWPMPDPDSAADLAAVPVGLVMLNGAGIARWSDSGPGPGGPGACAGSAWAAAAGVARLEIGATFCVRTGAGRVGFLTVKDVSSGPALDTVVFRYTVWT